MPEQKSTDHDSHDFLAGCAAGLENLVGSEVAQFGGDGIVVNAGVVRWRGTLESAYRCCLWSRYASRVFLELWRFPVSDEESLYTASLSRNWHEHLNENTTFAVNCTMSGVSQITHSRFASLKLKDGLVDYFRERYGSRPSVKTDRPQVQFHLHIENNLATVSLDFSGESLHRRGYRDSTGRAPLKETLGAAIVAMSGWLNVPQPLVDPMCGTGTLLIEAALMFGDCAPGLSRSYFGFTGWKGHNEYLWRHLVDEAMSREEAGETKVWPAIVGYDSDPEMVRAARKNIRKAGLENFISVQHGEVANLQSPSTTGVLLSNLPYGERLSETAVVTQLYRGYGRIIRERFHGWTTGVFIANADLTDSFGISWEARYRLYNGSIPCRLLVGKIVEGENQRFRWQPQQGSEEKNEGEFARRLRKNLKQMLRWSEKTDTACFRIYDSDLPEYNISIDLYGKWVHIQEWAPPKSIDPQIASGRFNSAVIAVKEILGVRSDRVFLKSRERQKGRKQYEKKGNTGKMHEVKEGHCSFLVNFTDYLDTGLFLDHRPVREKIFRIASGKRFLNLFGYTGTATIHAALGGASSTTTVDLSSTYLQWTRMNIALNGLSEITHTTEKADCLEWLTACTSTYDLIFMDPPTFSNTKKQMRIFEIQRDHVKLIDLAMYRLSDKGVLIFSTNFKRFLLDEGLRKKYNILDITRQSIPFDFHRNTRIHKCWEISHPQAGSHWPIDGERDVLQGKNGLQL